MSSRAFRLRRLLPAFFSLLLFACQPADVTTPDMSDALTRAYGTAVAQLATPTLTETPVPSPTAVRTPPALPGPFKTSLLDPLITPHIYLQDTCQALKAKWDPNNAAPGTVVMTIMFHSISKDAAVNADQISAADQKKLMNDLHDLGFQAINMTQMAEFLEHNAKIPLRSVLLIQDDRKTATNFNDHFRPFYEQWGWPVVNGWISVDGGQDIHLAENVALSAEGWVDYQAHGVIHNINITGSSDETFMLSELQGSMDNIQKYFHKAPIAYIWPGGSFTPRAAQLARQVGYHLGFTINPRGPVMFNWVPLADSQTSAYDIAEGPVNDPLMVLPRYWDTDARAHLDTVANLGEQAAAYAQQDKAVELEYYDIVCAPQYGAIP